MTEIPPQEVEAGPRMIVFAGPNGSGKTTLSLELQLIQPANHLNADDFARHTKHLVEVGAGIVGGCCGTTPEYIRKLAKALGR